MLILYILGFTILMFIWGKISLRLQIGGLIESADFTMDYHNRFVDFSNKYFQTYDIYHRSGRIDHEDYIWLTKNAPKMQSLLGYSGIHVFIHMGIQRNNYQIVVDTVSSYAKNNVSDEASTEAVATLLRQYGKYDEFIKKLTNRKTNPVTCFSEGLKQFMKIPFTVLNWFGLLSDSKLRNVEQSLFLKILALIGAIVTFASGVVTIIQGEKQTIEFVERLIFSLPF